MFDKFFHNVVFPRSMSSFFVIFISKVDSPLELWVNVEWVKWDDICRFKGLGGLGLNDLRLVNLSFLEK